MTPKGADEAADCSTLVSLIDTPRICSLTLEVRSIYRLPHRATASVLRPGLRRDHGQGCAHVSAEFPSSPQGARISGSYGDEEWPTGAEAPSSEGSQAAHREQQVAISPQCVPEGIGMRAGRHARFRPQRTRPASSRVPANLDQGIKVHGAKFTLFRFPNGTTSGRLGIAATRKLGGAVARNKAKRLIREVFRRNKLAPGFDIVIVPRRELLGTSLVALEREFRNTLERSARRSR